MNEPKMLPCPHCGDEFPLMTPNAAYGYKIRCEQCRTEFAIDCTAGRNFYHDKTVEAWNRRAPLPDNKALTGPECCDGCIDLKGTVERCRACVRFGDRVDLYRRPPEKGE